MDKIFNERIFREKYARTNKHFVIETMRCLKKSGLLLFSTVLYLLVYLNRHDKQVNTQFTFGLTPILCVFFELSNVPNVSFTTV